MQLSFLNRSSFLLGTLSYDKVTRVTSSTWSLVETWKLQNWSKVCHTSYESVSSKSACFWKHSRSRKVHYIWSIHTSHECFMITDILQTFMFIHCRYILSLGAHMCTRPRWTLSSCFMAWYDNYFVWFDVFTALLIKMTVFWNIILCWIGRFYWSCRGVYCLHLQNGDALASYHNHWTCFSLSNKTKSSKQFIFLGLPWRLEAASPSKKLVTNCWSMQCHIPEDCNHEYLL